LPFTPWHKPRMIGRVHLLFISGRSPLSCRSTF